MGGLRILKKLTRQYSPPEVLAHHATNDDSWGPSPRDLHELNALSFKPKLCAKILGVLEHRFSQSNRHWRQKSKGLTVLRYLLLNGSEQCLQWTRANQKRLLEPMLEFRYSDPKNIDQGVAVRERTAQILELIRDPERLKEERENYERQREEMRTSIGIGRPPSSRHTLDLVRSEIELELCDEPSPPLSPVPENHRFSLSFPLDAIQEEH